MKASVPGRIFVSYRRAETAWAAGRLFDFLADQFGRNKVFEDVDSIELGEDFVEMISNAVGSCDVHRGPSGPGYRMKNHGPF